MRLDLRKYGTNFTRDDIYTELERIGAQPSDIQYVTIAPGSSIPDYAFSSYKYEQSVFPNLELVYNLNTCVSIGEYAFSRCYMLRNTDISKASTIGRCAFDNCTGLTNIKIQPGVSLPYGCFAVCEQLSVVYNLNKCTSIGNSAFLACSLQTVDLSSCSNIDEYAFETCRNLTTVRLKPGIELKHGTFEGCTSLTTVYNLNQCTALNPENESPGVFGGCQSLGNSDISSCSYVGHETFLDCVSLTSMKLASGVEIQENAFYNCANLSRVDNIKQCRYIGDRAFYECGKLKKLDVSSAQHIGREAFYNTSLETLKFGNAIVDTYDWDSDTLFGNAKSTLREVTIPSGWSVPSCMFSDCSNLEVVYNLAYATAIGDTAFTGCGKLSNNQLLSCSSIGDYAFMSCSAVAFSNLPASPTIGSKAFGYCNGITKMTINGGTVGSDAFMECDNLSKVTIVSSPVRDSAFADCDNLEKVEMRGYTDLGSGAFIYCHKLKEVKLSTETFGIGAWCFADCSSLKKMYNLGVSTNISAIGSEFLSRVNLENNTIGASAVVLDPNALVGCNMPEWNLPNISIGDLRNKNHFGAPEGTTFKCKDGKTTKYGENTTIWFDDGTCNTVVASQSNTLTREDFISAGLMTPDYEWNKQPTRVVVGTNAQTLDYNLFQNCHKLSIVTMTSSTQDINTYTFRNCTSLKDIDLTYVRSFGSNAFQGCTSLNKVNLEAATYIEYKCFEGCTSLSKVTLSPSVSGIDSAAFANCTSLSTITIPSTVEEVGEEAFANSGLTKVDIKNGNALRTAQGAFKNCANLTKVTLPASGCEIPNECFKNCNGLQTVYNLNKCTKIGNSAFFGCSALTNNDVNRCNSIGDHAFQGCTAITQIKVKSGVSIGNNSFMGCSSIGTMYNLSYVGSIGDNALSGVSLSHNTIRALDSGLTSKSLSGCLNESWNLPNIYKSEAIVKNWYGANQGVTLKCKDGTIVSDNKDSLTVIDSTDSVLLKGVVDYNAIYDTYHHVSDIRGIRFGTAVTGIADNAFDAASGSDVRFEGVTIGDNVTSIGQYAFNGCQNLYSVYIGNNVTRIGQGAFSQTGISSITFPASLEYIDDGIFYFCNNLTGIYVDSSNPNFKSDNGLLLSKDGKILHEGVNGSYVYIPDGVEQIRPLAFGERTNLTSVWMPSTLKTIGSYAFEACGLTIIEIPNGVTSIEDNAFINCSGLTSVTIPDSVTSIGEYAFENCQQLGTISIGNGVKSIGDGAFNYCDLITSVTIPQLVLDIGLPTVFPQSYDKITYIDIASGATSISSGAFSGCSGLTSVMIPNSVTSIGDLAFQDLVGLTSVRIPDSVTNIGNMAFYNCTNLMSLTFLGKTLAQVQGMENYSWGVDPSIIQVG